MYFSCFAKKSTKRRRPRGAEFLAPARKAAPLETPGAHRHHYGTSCTTILSVKKCSDFLTDYSAEKTVILTFNLFRNHFDARRGIPKGAALVREQPASAPLWPPSLVTFLFGDKKVTLPHPRDFALQNFSTTPVECGKVSCGKICGKNSFHKACGKVIIIHIWPVDKKVLRA